MSDTFISGLTGFANQEKNVQGRTKTHFEGRVRKNFLLHWTVFQMSRVLTFYAALALSQSCKTGFKFVAEKKGFWARNNRQTE